MKSRIFEKIVEQACESLKLIEPLIELRDQKILAQLRSMGLASRDEVEALEKRIDSLEKKLERKSASAAPVTRAKPALRRKTKA